MCCFRSRVSKILIVVFSVLSVCGGLTMIGLTWYLMTDKGFNSANELKNGTQKLAIITGVAGAAAVVYGLLGIATAKVHRVLCVCSFGLFSVILLLYFIAISVGLLTVVLVPDQRVADFCNGTMPKSTPNWLLNILDKAKVKVNELDNKIIDVVDKYMCKTFCPCVPVNYSLWPEPL